LFNTSFHYFTIISMEPKKSKKPPGFEESLGRLEALIESMESGDTPLAELVTKFEDGNKLLMNCQKRLREAELKIEKIRKEKDTFIVEDFDPGVSAEDTSV